MKNGTLWYFLLHKLNSFSLYTDFDDDDDDYIIIVMVWCSHGRRHGYLHGK